MSQAQYDIYRSKVFSLVRSMVLKSSAAADAFNKGLEELRDFPVNRADPASWKYYLNLNGQYHSTDKLMRVTSLDTLQTIDFTKEVLRDHRSTMREYAFGSSFYEALVTRFPEQEVLIHGILNPVDIPTAIEAQDGEILYYDRGLVEENETNLIPELALWCKNFLVRWNVSAYGVVDDLYPVVIFSTMIALMPAQVMNLRLRNCHTLYAHSFHIREFLASNGKLDEYVDFLTKRQALWLYRNLRYLLRNAGKRETFMTLIQHILTERGLPLAEWRMRHNVKDQIENIYPEVEFRRRNLNLGLTDVGADIINIPTLLDKEQTQAKGNPAAQADAEISVRQEMRNSLSNQLNTKVLESSVLDLTDSSPYTLSDALINHWLYFAQTGRYVSVVTVDNFKAGGTITLTVKEAFIVFLYAYNLSMGIKLINIPKLQALMVRRDPAPTLAKLKTLVDPWLVPDAVLSDLLFDMTVLGTYISIPAFYDACYSIYEDKLRQRLIYSNQEHFEARGQAEAAMQHIYLDYTVDLAPGETYDAWFADKGLDIPTFTSLEAEELASQLYARCTGVDLKPTQSLRAMHDAMLRLMAQMSSYSIQFLQSINSNAILVVDWPVIRPGDSEIYLRHEEFVHAIDVDAQSLRAKKFRYDDLDLDEIGPEIEVETVQRGDVEIDIGLTEEQVGSTRHLIQVQNTMIDVLEVINNLPEIGPDTPQLSVYEYTPPGYTPLSLAFNYLDSPDYQVTPVVRQDLEDRYQAYLNANSPFKTPLIDVLPIQRLASLLPFLRE